MRYCSVFCPAGVAVSVKSDILSFFALLSVCLLWSDPFFGGYEWLGKKRGSVALFGRMVGGM